MDSDVTLVVYSARCSWWDDIRNAGNLPVAEGHPLPCCPHCRSVLFQVEVKEWNLGVADFQKVSGDEHYTDFINWLRGRCFPGPNGLADARQKYQDTVAKSVLTLTKPEDAKSSPPE
jgi:hypothetical protein